MEQVVIAGGGPTGLMPACELKLAGADPLVLERLASPSGESRAGGLHPRTLEILDMRGMVEAFLAEGRPLAGAHFAGLRLDFSGLDTKYPYLLVILRRYVERLLEDHARSLGVRFQRPVSVAGLTQHDDHVAVETTAGPLAAEYPVGCDGGRSTVRRLAGIDFPAPTSACTAHAGSRAITTGRGWPRPTVPAASCWPAMPPTSITRPAARVSTPGSRTRSTWLETRARRGAAA